MFVKRIMEMTSCFCWCCCCFLEANNVPCFDSLWHSSNRSKKQPHASSNFQCWFYFSVLGLLVLVEQILDCNTSGNSSVFFSICLVFIIHCIVYTSQVHFGYSCCYDGWFITIVLKVCFEEDSGTWWCVEPHYGSLCN